MINKAITLFLCIYIANIIYVNIAEATGMVKVVIKIVDESGVPVENANLNIRFSSNSETVKGKTDSKGIFETTALSNDGVVLGDINKEGYYESGIAHSFLIKKLGFWQPWGKELSVVMRPIVNPVPMYVRDNWFDIPEAGKEIGFDLMKADWVIPYGQGSTADFVFKVDRRYENIDNFDVTLTLTFSNPFDGILNIKDDGGGDFNVGSAFRLPRIAPPTSYETKFITRRSTSDPRTYSTNPDDNNYIFRVRSEVDEEGKFKRAMYGKIRGRIKVGPQGHKGGHNVGGVVGINYYLNPDYTPNLEFDPKRNLFISLPSDENVRQP